MRQSEWRLVEPVARALETGERVGVMLPDDWIADLRPALYPWGPWGNQAVLGRRLFAGLRALDGAGVDRIVCPVPVAGGIADAIRDRLEKAAQ